MRGVAKKTRRKHHPVEEWGTFLFEIRKVHAHYSFGDGSRLDRTAYSEHFQPEIEACCVAPEKFKDRMTRFTLIGDRSNECDLWVQTYALEKHEAGVGTLTFRGAQ